MNLIKFIIPLLFSITFFPSGARAQSETAKSNFYHSKIRANTGDLYKTKEDRLPVKSFFLPGLMLTYGFSAIESDGFKKINYELRDEIYTEHPHNKFRIDNYLQFAPAVLTFGLDASGIKAKHNLVDRSMLMLMSTMVTTGSVFTIKKISCQMRPDASDYLSFPSGHTAEAFANAEFMRQEYKHLSPWYGIAGYTLAATTGYLRMYNNKHWLSDVVAGAGIGIASTKFAYWLYPKIKQQFYKNKPVKTILIPSYQHGNLEMGLIHKF